MLSLLKKSSKQSSSVARKDKQDEFDPFAHETVIYAAKDKDTGLEFAYSAPPGSKHGAKAQQIAAEVYSQRAAAPKVKSRLLGTAEDTEPREPEERKRGHDQAAVEEKHPATGFRHDSGIKTTYVLKGQGSELFVSAPNGTTEAAIHDHVVRRARADGDLDRTPGYNEDEKFPSHAQERLATAQHVFTSLKIKEPVVADAKIAEVKVDKVSGKMML